MRGGAGAYRDPPAPGDGRAGRAGAARRLEAGVNARRAEAEDFGPESYRPVGGGSTGAAAGAPAPTATPPPPRALIVTPRARSGHAPGDAATEHHVLLR